MTQDASQGSSKTPSIVGLDPALKRLTCIGVVSWILYVLVLRLSSQFAFDVAAEHRPIPLVLGIFAALFGLYLAALWNAVRAAHPWPVILLFSAAFRLLLLFSEPIQEVDIYRYVWDGQVVTAGISPYRFSPGQVQAASADDPSLPDELTRLAALRDRDPLLALILSRIHFEELTTIYPPVSQAVFAAAAAITPQGATLATQLVVMKAWLVGFDLLTLVILLKLLQATRRPVGWVVAYGWCPLVLKEFANSGHLDSIAVCLTLLALWLAVQGMTAADSRIGRRWSLLSFLILALATGAKVYPVVLCPLMFVNSMRLFGWKPAAASGVAYSLLCAAVTVHTPA